MKRLVILACLLVAGCGGPAGDLFEVKRTGADPNANITLVVSEDGFVTCNGKRHEVPGDTLLDARELTRDLSPQAELNLALPPGPKSVLTYNVRMQAGTIVFSDTSRPLPSSFAKLTVFTKHVSEDVCGLNRN